MLWTWILPSEQPIATTSKAGDETQQDMGEFHPLNSKIFFFVLMFQSCKGPCSLPIRTCLYANNHKGTNIIFYKSSKGRGMITLFRYVSGCIIQLGLNFSCSTMCPNGARLSSTPLNAHKNMLPHTSTLTICSPNNRSNLTLALWLLQVATWKSIQC